MKLHKHAKLIKAWADGAEIEERRILSNNEWSEWYSFDCTWWNGDNYEFRIKPEPKPDVVVKVNYWYDLEFNECQRMIESDIPNLKLTFDGETGELKSAEVLK